MRRLPGPSSLQSVLGIAMSIDDAVGGDVQRYERSTNVLELVVWRGYDDEALAHFRVTRVDSSTSCGQCLAEGRRVVIRDVTSDRGFTPHRPFAERCGWRAIQSTPLKAMSGRRIGVLSTHFAKPHHPSTQGTLRLDHCCTVASLLLECVQARDDALAHGITVQLTRRAGIAADTLPGLLARMTDHYDEELLDRTARELTHIARQFAANA